MNNMKCARLESLEFEITVLKAKLAGIYQAVSSVILEDRLRLDEVAMSRLDYILEESSPSLEVDTSKPAPLSDAFVRFLQDHDIEERMKEVTHDSD